MGLFETGAIRDKAGLFGTFGFSDKITSHMSQKGKRLIKGADYIQTLNNNESDYSLAC